MLYSYYERNRDKLIQYQREYYLKKKKRKINIPIVNNSIIFLNDKYYLIL